MAELKKLINNLADSTKKLQEVSPTAAINIARVTEAAKEAVKTQQGGTAQPSPKK